MHDESLALARERTVKAIKEKHARGAPVKRRVINGVGLVARK
jgi:hypothetical protein